MMGTTRSTRYGVHAAKSKVTAPAMISVAEEPVSSSSPRTRVITMMNLLAATVMNVSASRQPIRRSEGNVASGTTIGHEYEQQRQHDDAHDQLEPEQHRAEHDDAREQEHAKARRRRRQALEPLGECRLVLDDSRRRGRRELIHRLRVSASRSAAPERSRRRTRAPPRGRPARAPSFRRGEGPEASRRVAPAS